MQMHALEDVARGGPGPDLVQTRNASFTAKCWRGSFGFGQNCLYKEGGGQMVLWRRVGWLYYSGAGGKRESGENIGASCSSKYGAQPLSTAATLTDRYFLLVTNQHKRSFGLVSEMRKPMPSFFAIISVDELNTCKQNCSHF